MRYFCTLLFASSLLVAQAFDPKMPAGVPEVSGKVTEVFALRWIDVAEGTGAPAVPGKQYKVHYTGWLRDGKKFDSSRDKNEPFTFTQGARQVISGWEAGFEGMKVGGKRRLFIPYQMAYGEAGRGSIPPKAELIFDVELLDVTEPTSLPAAVDVIFPLDQLEKQVTSLLAAIPDDKLDWRPGPGVRSFREVFLHIAAGNHLILSFANDPKTGDALNKSIEDTQAAEHQKVDKAQMQKLIADSFAEVRKAIQESRPAALGREADFFGNKTSRRGIFTILDTHVGEHLGQLIAYSRVNGIVPPWSK